MPSGMTSPLLVEVVKGNTGLALVLTLTTALLAPFTIPLIIQTLAGTAVTVSALTMFGKLAIVIILPFALAQLVRHFWRRHLKITFFTFKPISLIFLGLLIAGEIAKQAWVITNGFGSSLLIQLFDFNGFHQPALDRRICSHLLAPGQRSTDFGRVSDFHEFHFGYLSGR
jgi:predicted Na+-dependent transporter